MRTSETHVHAPETSAESIRIEVAPVTDTLLPINTILH